jgi:hypothetical protein
LCSSCSLWSIRVISACYLVGTGCSPR